MHGNLAKDEFVEQSTPIISVVAFVAIFVSWLILEFKCQRASIRVAMGCLFPAVFLAGIIETNIIRDVEDFKSNLVFGYCIDEMAKTLSEEGADSVLAALSTVQARRNQSADVHENIWALYELLLSESDLNQVDSVPHTDPDE